MSQIILGRKYSVLIICILLLFTIFPSFLVSSEGSVSILIVDQNNTNGPWDGSWNYPYRSIQDAIDNAVGGEEIIVFPGTYIGNVVIDVPVHIVGYESPSIYGNYNQSVITISSDDVRLQNFIISYSGGYRYDAGITYLSIDNVTISDCVIHHTRNGMIIDNGRNIVLKNTSFLNNGNGIFINESESVSFYDCKFSNNAIGIVIKNTSQIDIDYSSFTGNGMSGYFSYSTDLSVDSCNLSDNSVNKGGFFIESSSIVTIDNTLFYHNGDGLSLSDCSNISITNCEFLYNTHFAVSLRQPCKDIFILHSIISDNLRSGIYLEENNDCVISSSNIFNNYLYDVTGDFFYCDARNNWWGTPFGPFNGYNKMFTFLRFVDSYPWVENSFESAGLVNRSLPVCSDLIIAPAWQINLSGVDSDGDMVPDWWEEKWGYSSSVKNDHLILDPDEDALNNIQECFTDSFGSNPFVKDVFLEVDWIKGCDDESNKPSQDLIDEIIQRFADHNITLHVDIGNLGGGQEIPLDCENRLGYLELHDLYWTYFLNNSLQHPRKGIFHYGIICNYCGDLNFPFMGWDGFDSFAISAEWLEESFVLYNREDIIAGALMHHLGHTLGLIADDHEGIDNVATIHIFSIEWMKFLSYYSCMNYFYKYVLLDYSDGSHGSNDFNDWDNIEFDYFQKSEFRRD